MVNSHQMGDLPVPLVTSFATFFCENYVVIATFRSLFWAQHAMVLGLNLEKENVLSYFDLPTREVYKFWQRPEVQAYPSKKNEGEPIVGGWIHLSF